MSVIKLTIEGGESKTIQDAVRLLNENGFVAEVTESLKDFCMEEAHFRINEMEILSDEEKENLTEDEMMNLTYIISQSFFNSDIFDYDYMDDIVRECYAQIINERK